MMLSTESPFFVLGLGTGLGINAGYDYGGVGGVIIAAGISGISALAAHRLHQRMINDDINIEDQN